MYIVFTNYQLTIYLKKLGKREQLKFKIHNYKKV